MPTADTTIDALNIPTCPSSLLGYCGPMRYRYPGEDWILDYHAWHPRGSAKEMAFPAEEAITRDWLLRWLAAGDQCPGCDSFGAPDLHEEPCDGWTRKPSPAYHLRDKASGGTLDPEHAAQALAWSVASVRAGGDVLAGVFGEWVEIRPGAWARAVISGDPSAGVNAGIDMGILTEDGWSVALNRAIVEYGPETGAEGRAKADDTALRAGFAYIDAGRLVVPG